MTGWKIGRYARFEKLEELHISIVMSGKIEIDFPGCFPKLKHLLIRNCSRRDTCVFDEGNAPRNLVMLSHDGPLPNFQLLLRMNPSLTELALSTDEASNNSIFEAIIKAGLHEKLERLTIVGWLNDAAYPFVRAVSAFNNLKHLSIECCGFGPLMETIQAFWPMRQLSSLEIKDNNEEEYRNDDDHLANRKEFLMAVAAERFSRNLKQFTFKSPHVFGSFWDDFSAAMPPTCVCTIHKSRRMNRDEDLIRRLFEID